MKPDPLRIGVLIDSFTQPRWVHRIIEDIQQSQVAEVVLVVVNENPPRPGFPVRLKRLLDYSLFAAYQRFDTYWFKDGLPNPFETTDVTPLLPEVAQMRVTPKRTEDAGELGNVTIEEILGFRLDVALRFGFPNLRGPALSIAKHGVWSYQDREEPVNGRAPTGFWEVMDDKPVTGSVLQIDTDEPGRGKAIYRSFSSTAPVSVWKNRREVYCKASAFVLRKLRDLSARGPSALEEPLPPADGNGRPSRAPTNLALVRSLPKLVGRYASLQVAQRTHFEQWFLAYKFSDQGRVEEGVPEEAPEDFHRLIPPADRFWADPFPIKHRGRYYILFEELVFAHGKGHIAALELDEVGGASRPEVVLQNDHHLSYPFVLNWKGEVFLIPESARAGAHQDRAREDLAVLVYRARSFPNQWDLETSMLQGLEVFDPTVVEIDGTWWLFCTRAEPGASTWDELHLFHGQTPFGPWKPHRRNPIKSDARSPRPAGRPFQSGGQWFRPAQDCSVQYGYAISINRILKLTPTEYEEIEVSRINPNWAPDLIGTHTLNAAGRLTVIDGMMRRRR